MSTIGQLPQLPSTGSSALGTVLNAVTNSPEGQAASAAVNATANYVATPIVKYFVGGIGAALILIGIIELGYAKVNSNTFEGTARAAGLAKKGVAAAAAVAA